MTWTKEIKWGKIQVISVTFSTPFDIDMQTDRNKAYTNIPSKIMNLIVINYLASSHNSVLKKKKPPKKGGKKEEKNLDNWRNKIQFHNTKYNKNTNINESRPALDLGGLV